MNTPNPESHTSGRARRGPTAKVGLALGAAVVLYLAFEIGRFTAGYSILDAMHEHELLRNEITLLKSDNRVLQTRVEELRTLNVGHSHEEQVVTRTIARLQAQIARQSEKIAFYRGVVAQGAPPIGLRLGEVLLSPGKRPRHYHVDMSLVRADRPDGEVSGTVSLSADGAGSGETRLNDQVLTGEATDLKYHFRYYQEIKADLVLPAGFKPAHLTVTVHSSRRNVAPLIRAYPWGMISVP